LLNTLLHRRLRAPPQPMLWLLPAWLRQHRMMVADVESLGFPVLVRLYQLVR
jgi:hypothetical protein